MTGSRSQSPEIATTSNPAVSSQARRSAVARGGTASRWGDRSKTLVLDPSFLVYWGYVGGSQGDQVLPRDRVRR